MHAEKEYRQEHVYVHLVVGNNTTFSTPDTDGMRKYKTYCFISK